MIKAWLERDPGTDRIHLYVFSGSGSSGKKYALKKVELIFKDIGEPGPLEFRKYAPFMTFEGIQGSELLKAIAGALKEYGLLPTEDNPGELKATKYHLEDMRRISFKWRNIEFKEK